MTPPDTGFQALVQLALKNAHTCVDSIQIVPHCFADGINDSESRLWLSLEAAEMGTWTWDPVRDAFDFDDRALRILGVGDSRDLMAGTAQQ